MTALFNRQFAINVGGLSIATSAADSGKIQPTLRLGFRIERMTAKDPNPAELTIYNLSSETRSFLTENSTKTLATTIALGYAARSFQAYSGNLQKVVSQRTGVDWITKLQLLDGGTRYSSARINESRGPGVTLQEAITTAAKAMGLPLGNLTQQISRGNVRGSAPGTNQGTTSAFARGLVLSGKAEEQFDKLMALAGYEWSIQDGQIQVLVPGEALPTEAVVLNYESGLVGSPERGDDGTVKARSLIQPGLFPGRAVAIDGLVVAGMYRIERVVFTGDTWGQDWYADLEGKAIAA